MSRSIPLICAAVLAAFSSALGAHTIDDACPPSVAETITVMSAATPNIEAPPGAATTILRRDDIEERRPEHLADAVDRVAGVSQRGDGPPAVPVVRGLAGGRTLLIVDGSRITAERRAGPSGTFLNPFTLGSIEISRGPASVEYGSDALGGVIHARVSEPEPGQSHLRYGTTWGLEGSGIRSAGVEYSQSLGEASSLSALVHARDSNGSDAAGGVRIDNSEYAGRGVGLRFVRPAMGGVLRAALAFDHARDVGAPSADSLVNRTFYPKERSRRLTMGWVSSRFEVNASLGSYDITTARERAGSAEASDVRADDALVRAVVTQMTSRGRLRAGADFTTRFNLQAINNDDEVAVDDAQKFDTGVFAVYDWAPSAGVMLSGGIRGDRVRTENRGGFFGDRSRSRFAMSGHAAATVMLFPSLTATLQAARGFRDPSLSDRYFRGVSGRGFVIGNPDLEPETSTQFDGALRWRRGRQSVAVHGYRYAIHDLVERFREGADFQFRNRGEAGLSGVEIEAATQLPRGFAIEVNGAIARGEADGTTPLDDIAPPNLGASLRWDGGRTSAFLYVSTVAADDRPGPVEVYREAHTTTDIGFAWSLTRAVEWSVLVRNVFDERYAGSADANAALAPGRAVVIGLGGTF